MYPTETKRAKIKRCILVRLCFPFCRPYCVFSFSSTSNVKLQVKVEYVKDKWITFMVSSHPVLLSTVLKISWGHLSNKSLHDTELFE